MVNITSFVVGAKCFFDADKSGTDLVPKINSLIAQKMIGRGFSTDDNVDLFRGIPTFMMRFYANPTKHNPPLVMRIKKGLGIINQEELDDKVFFDALSRLVDEHPHKISFSIKIGQISNNRNGYLIKIETEPAIVAKKRNLGIEPRVNATRYNEIIDYNKKLVHEIINELGAGILEEPKVLAPLDKILPDNLFEENFMTDLPREVAECLTEVNKCFSNDCYIASSIMIRKALEVAVTKKLDQAGRGKKLFDDNGDEISLKRKLNLLPEVAPNIKKDLEAIKIVKWFGDKSAHSPNNPIFAKDIEQNIVPKIRYFLINLGLKK